MYTVNVSNENCTSANKEYNISLLIYYYWPRKSSIGHAILLKILRTGALIHTPITWMTS